MKILRVKSQKWFKVALAIVIAMSLAVPIGIYQLSNKAYAAGDVSMSYSNHYSYFGQTNCSFTMNGVTGYCAQPSLPRPNAGNYTKEACPTLYGSIDKIADVLYYGYGGPGFDTSMWPETCCGQAWTNEYYEACTHVLVADRVYADVNAALAGTTDEFRNWAMWNIVGYNPSTGEWQMEAVGWKMSEKGSPYGFKESVYAINTGSTTTQTLVSYEWVGDFEATKQSSNTSISDNNSCYSLAGAVYSIYSDANCTNKVGETTTDANGYMKSPSFGRCTVYVKETTAAPGYALDENVYTVNIEPKTTAKLNGGVVYDTPQNDPVNILLKKVDKQTGKGTPQGSATLKGAQFTVRYYDTTDATSLSKDYATRVSQAKKTWVYETQDDGKIKIQSDTPISGDTVYTDQWGTTTFPVGIYVIEETLAPTGYLLPNYQNRTFIEVVTAKENGSETNPDTYHTQTYQPDGLSWSSWKLDGES